MTKRKPASPDAPEVNARMRRHVGQLELRSLDAYLKWCGENGFRASYDKSSYDRAEELQARDQQKARAAEQVRIHHNPVRLIEKACAGEILAKDVRRQQLHMFCRSIEKSAPEPDARASLRDLLLAVNEKTDFLLDGVSIAGRSYAYVDALIKLNDRRRMWVRPLAEWKPATHNARKQFSSLVRHLVARFPVPEFMDQAWLRTDQGSNKHRTWFCHLGAGKNIRTAKTPVPMTKMMAHHFLEAPDTATIEGALRWGQVHALGGDETLWSAVQGTRIAERFEDDEFWQSVIRFFVANPMLDRRHVGPIVDYVHNQKFEIEEVYAGHGRVERRPPPQPNMSMRGRTADSMLAAVERWHRALGRVGGAETIVFRRSPLKGLELKAGKDGENTWLVRQLMSSGELVKESQVMQHCVLSYARSCAAGHCTIWAMELRQPTKTDKRQTIEVARNGQIVQCRGKQNRLPTRGEFEILQEWARAAGLSISQYVRPAE